MKDCVYLLRHSSGKVYVGQAAVLHKRILQHKTSLRRGDHSNPHLQRAYDLGGWEDFMVEVLEIGADDLDVREQFWIDFLHATNPEHGYNIAKIAGAPPREERFLSDEARRKMGASRGKGWNHTEATKATIRAAARRRWADPELRAKMSRAFKVPKPGAKGKKKPDLAKRLAKPFVVIAPDGTEYRGSNLKAFCQEHGIPYAGMASAARGAAGKGRARYFGRGRDRNTAGWQCEFKE